jgi:hypothetical protein
MAKFTHCLEPKCQEQPLNQKLQLKSGGIAICGFCAKHAAARGFVLPKTPATPVAAK